MAKKLPPSASVPPAASAKAPSPANPATVALDAAFSSVVPAITKETYAKHTGLSVRTVEAQLARGYLPSIKLGRHRLINLIQLRQMCMQ